MEGSPDKSEFKAPDNPYAKEENKNQNDDDFLDNMTSKFKNMFNKKEDKDKEVTEI